MRALPSMLLVCLLAVVAGGCDKTGIHPLGVARDVTGNCDTPTSTWIRSTDTGTELLVIGSVKPTDDVDQATPRCFARGTIDHDSSTSLDVGEYVLSAGAGTFTYPYHYAFPYQPNTALLSRTGSKRTDLMPPTTEAVAFTIDGDGTLLATINGAEHRYTNLVEVIKRITPDTQEAATELFRVYNIPLMTEQNRLIGFGSAGMTQYIAAPGNFKALIANSFSVTVNSLADPTVHITYDNFQDVTGITLDGTQVTSVNLQGEGGMDQGMNYVMFGPGGQSDKLFTGFCDYGPLEVHNGIAGGGHYDFTIDGYGTFQMDWTLAANLDLRATLPVVTP